LADELETEQQYDTNEIGEVMEELQEKEKNINNE
jgi:hypothetical protein